MLLKIHTTSGYLQIITNTPKLPPNTRMYPNVPKTTPKLPKKYKKAAKSTPKKTNNLKNLEYI